MEMLRMISFSLFVQPEQYERYRGSLYSHVAPQPGGAIAPQAATPSTEAAAAVVAAARGLQPGGGGAPAGGGLHASPPVAGCSSASRSSAELGGGAPCEGGGGLCGGGAAAGCGACGSGVFASGAGGLCGGATAAAAQGFTPPGCARGAPPAVTSPCAAAGATSPTLRVQQTGFHPHQAPTTDLSDPMVE